MLVGRIGVHTTLELGRHQSTQDVDRGLPENLDQPLSPQELERRISFGKAAVIQALVQDLSERGLHRTVDLYAHMELAELAGVGCLVALEEMALAELSALWGGGLSPLSQTLQYETKPGGELVFRMDGEHALAQGEWEERFNALDEVVLRLAGTSGSAQTFRHGQRVGGLREILSKVAHNEERRHELQSATVGAGAFTSVAEGKAQKALRILDKHVTAEFHQADWWVKVAKLEEVVLEVLGFIPLKRSFVIAPVPAEVPAEPVFHQ